MLKHEGLLSASAIQELIELCDRRVYLFVDDAADKLRDLEALFERIGPTGSKLTVILAERLNEWNVVCQSLNRRITETYEVKYLTTPEVNTLIELLEKHKAEGVLQGLTIEDKRSAFLEVAGRQLLVALHEATLGKTFRDIIQNEFDHIWPLDAKHIYLTICTLNRLNVPVRAGIIARLHGVPFDEFKAKFFDPLEHIVQAEFDAGSRDYVYRARHPYIAQMVFEDVLNKQEERFEQYVRCLSALNLDYSSDRIAFRQMTRAKTVLELFPNHELALAIYERGQERAGPSDGTLLHQLGLYELNRANGSLTRSSELLTLALDLRRNDPSIKHSFAELHLRIAEDARTSLEREKHLAEAAVLCWEVIGKGTTDAYAYVTLVKVGLKRLEEAIKDGNAITIEQTVKETEGALRDGLQRFPNDSYLREAESRLAEAIEDSERAITALHQAFQTNPRSAFIAIRLSQALMNRKDKQQALHVLETALGANSGDRRLHHAYAKLLISTGSANDKILYHLQRSFAPGDSNYDAQVLYGRQLYLSGDLEAARKLFKVLKVAPTSPDVKYRILYPVEGTFAGEIARMEATYCFIARDGVGDWVYGHRDNVGYGWAALEYRKRVRFRLGFAFGGPSAFDLHPE